MLGLDSRPYVDQLEPGSRKTQVGDVTIDSEVDWIYLDTPDDCVIVDPSLSRAIRIVKTGSRSTVVWNPWIEKARRMTDCGDDEYLERLCVETTNAMDDVVEVAPDAEHRIGVVISVEDAP